MAKSKKAKIIIGVIRQYKHELDLGLTTLKLEVDGENGASHAHTILVRGLVADIEGDARYELKLRGKNPAKPMRLVKMKALAIENTSEAEASDHVSE